MLIGLTGMITKKLGFYRPILEKSHFAYQRKNFGNMDDRCYEAKATYGKKP